MSDYIRKPWPTSVKIRLPSFFGLLPPDADPQGMMNRTWKTTSKDVHNFRAEFLFIRSLAHKGVLTICNNASPKDCGLRDENPREEEGLHTESDVSRLGVSCHLFALREPSGSGLLCLVRRVVGAVPLE